MTSLISEAIKNCEHLLKLIQRGAAVNVNDEESRNQALDFAKFFFEKVRPSNGRVIDPSIDEKFQRLVELSQGKNARKQYIELLRQIAKNLKVIEAKTIGQIAGPSDEASITLDDDSERVFNTLNSMLPSAASSYRQAVADLSEVTRHSYRGSAAELRETLRETLDHLAPDPKVITTPNFKLEKDQTKPTMKQKVKFILGSRGLGSAQLESSTKSIETVNELAGQFARSIYTEASVATHTQRAKQDVIRLKRYIDTILFDLLELH